MLRRNPDRSNATFGAEWSTARSSRLTAAKVSVSAARPNSVARKSKSALTSSAKLQNSRRCAPPRFDSSIARQGCDRAATRARVGPAAERCRIRLQAFDPQFEAYRIRARDCSGRVPKVRFRIFRRQAVEALEMPEMRWHLDLSSADRGA